VGVGHFDMWTLAHGEGTEEQNGGIFHFSIWLVYSFILICLVSTLLLLELDCH